MNDKILLSICIATYNRKDTLLKLIRNILSVKDEGFDVIVTDNCSTDGTEVALQTIEDKRLKVFKNDSPLPGLNNMIQSIYNGDAKYAFYCNDRDLLFPDMIKIILNVLKEDDYSFVFFKRSGKHRIVKTRKYLQGYDSIIHHDFTHHPTGCVINTRRLNEVREKEYYYSWLHTQYPLDYLIRDVMFKGNTAVNYSGVWNENTVEFKKKNHSGAVPGKINFFDPECITYNCAEILKQINNYSDLELNISEKKEIMKQVVVYNGKQLTFYKQYLSNKGECDHYGRQPRFVSTMELIGIYNKYLDNIRHIVQKEIGIKFPMSEPKTYFLIIIKCIIIDIRNLFNLW